MSRIRKELESLLDDTANLTGRSYDREGLLMRLEAVCARWMERGMAWLACEPYKPGGAMGERRCCVIDCAKMAEFEIITTRRSSGIAGPDPYSDNTDACTAHVGNLLGYQPDAARPGEIYWEVVAIPAAARTEVR